MIFYYLDASAWVKRYYQEIGTRWLGDLFSQHPTFVGSTLGLIEVIATLARKQKSREISSSSFEQKVHELEEDWGHFIQIQLTVEAVGIAKETAKDFALRGADAIHLASALMLQRRFTGENDKLTFVTSDHELKEAAQSAGIAVTDPHEEESALARQSEDKETSDEEE